MGFLSNVVGGVRKAFSSEREKAELAHGQTVPQSLPSGLLAAYGNDFLSDYLRLDSDLLARYADYEEMDDYPELATSLDIYADDATQTETTLNKTLWVTSTDDNVRTILEDLFHRTLRVDDDNWEISRTLAKYGNDYEEILINQDGVRGLNYLPPATVRRIEGARGELLGFIQDFQGRTNITPEQFKIALERRQKGQETEVVALEDWEVCHFRLRGRQRRSVYGHSVLEPARWIWKRLMLLEDAALVYRLQRAPERYAFYVDTGDLPPQEALAYLNKVRQGHKKRRYVDPATGKLNLRWEPLTQDEDFYIPVRKGSESARIEVLGSPAWQSMDDIEYFRDKLFAAIKVPKAYLGQEAGVARAILSSEDVRFARTVLRLQREIKNGYRKISRVHLAALGIDPSSVDYDVWMTVPSSIFELAQLEVRNARADLAGRMASFVSLHWMLSKVFGLSDDEIATIIEERGEDAKREGKNQAAIQSAVQGATMGGVEQPGVTPGDFGVEEPPEDGEEPPPDDGSEPPDQEAKKRIKPSLMGARKIILPNSLHGRQPFGITERELLAGTRDSNKRAEAKLEELMRSTKTSDRMLIARLQNVASMVREIHATAKRRR